LHAGNDGALVRVGDGVTVGAAVTVGDGVALGADDVVFVGDTVGDVVIGSTVGRAVGGTAIVVGAKLGRKKILSSPSTSSCSGSWW
jgi:UDP-3-O-[3-hydroxymyristoyl] glucosamine N-acyltransferase